MPDEALRFDLRLDARGVELELVTPIRVGPARLLVCEVRLAPPAGPMDLSGGAESFRHHRSELRALRVELPYAYLTAHAAARGVPIELEVDPERGRLRVESPNWPRALSLAPLASAEGTVWVPFTEGGEQLADPELVDVLVAGLRRVAGEAERAGAAVRVAAPDRWLLREAFASRGYRVPRSASLPSALIVGRRGLVWLAGGCVTSEPLARGLEARLTDIASLIDRSETRGAAAALRAQAARVEGARAPAVPKDADPKSGEG